MEERLRPLNGLLALLKPHDLTPALLHAAGFRLQGLEVPVTAGDLGTVVIDAVLFHPKHSLLVVCESKSGANVEAPQARKYAALDPSAVVKAARVTLTERITPTAVPLYVCQGQHYDRIKQGLASEEIECPVIGVSQDRIIFDCPDSTPEPLRAALLPSPLELTAPLPRLIELDEQSPVEMFEPSVSTQLVAALAHSLQQVSVRFIAEQAMPYLALYGQKARGLLVRKVGDAARKIAAADPLTFAYQPPGDNDRDGGLVHLLKTPEDKDLRGRTQAYQALTRAGRTRRRKAAPVDPGQLDLLRELEQAEDDSGDDMADSGEGTL